MYSGLIVYQGGTRKVPGRPKYPRRITTRAISGTALQDLHKIASSLFFIRTQLSFFFLSDDLFEVNISRYRLLEDGGNTPTLLGERGNHASLFIFI